MTKGHWSDCAIYNAPAFEPGPCDCGGLDLAAYELYRSVTALIPTPGGLADFVRNGEAPGLVETHYLEPHRLAADTAPSDLPDTHDRIASSAGANRVDFDNASETVISDGEALALVQGIASDVPPHKNRPLKWLWRFLSAVMAGVIAFGLAQTLVSPASGSLSAERQRAIQKSGVCQGESARNVIRDSITLVSCPPDIPEFLLMRFVKDIHETSINMDKDSVGLLLYDSFAIFQKNGYSQVNSMHGGGGKAPAIFRLTHSVETSSPLVEVARDNNLDFVSRGVPNVFKVQANVCTPALANGLFCGHEKRQVALNDFCPRLTSELLVGGLRFIGRLPSPNRGGCGGSECQSADQAAECAEQPSGIGTASSGIGSLPLGAQIGGAVIFALLAWLVQVRGFICLTQGRGHVRYGLLYLLCGMLLFLGPITAIWWTSSS